MEIVLDPEWIKLMLEAKKLGMSCEEIRNYINETAAQMETGTIEDFFSWT